MFTAEGSARSKGKHLQLASDLGTNAGFGRVIFHAKQRLRFPCCPPHRMPPAALGKPAGLTVQLTLCPRLERGDMEMGQTERATGPGCGPFLTLGSFGKAQKGCSLQVKENSGRSLGRVWVNKEEEKK